MMTKKDFLNRVDDLFEEKYKCVGEFKEDKKFNELMRRGILQLSKEKLIKDIIESDYRIYSTLIKTNQWYFKDTINQIKKNILNDLSKKQLYINKKLLNYLIVDKVCEKHPIGEFVEEVERLKHLINDYTLDSYGNDFSLAFNVKVYDIHFDIEEIKNNLLIQAETNKEVKEIKTLQQGDFNRFFRYYQEHKWESAEIDLQSKFENVKEIFSEGRSGGWMVVETYTDYYNIYRDLENILQGYDSFEWMGNNLENAIGWVKNEIKFINDLQSEVDHIVDKFKVNYTDFVKNNCELEDVI